MLISHCGCLAVLIFPYKFMVKVEVHLGISTCNLLMNGFMMWVLFVFSHLYSLPQPSEARFIHQINSELCCWQWGTYPSSLLGILGDSFPSAVEQNTRNPFSSRCPYPSGYSRFLSLSRFNTGFSWGSPASIAIGGSGLLRVVITSLHWQAWAQP